MRVSYIRNDYDVSLTRGVMYHLFYGEDKYVLVPCFTPDDRFLKVNSNKTLKKVKFIYDDLLDKIEYCFNDSYSSAAIICGKYLLYWLGENTPYNEAGRAIKNYVKVLFDDITQSISRGGMDKASTIALFEAIRKNSGLFDFTVENIENLIKAANEIGAVEYVAEFMNYGRGLELDEVRFEI